MLNEKIRSILSLGGHSQTDLAKEWGMSKQALSNKIRRQYFNASDLVKLAKFCGAELAFTMPNGSKVVLDETDIKVDKQKPGFKPGSKSKVVKVESPKVESPKVEENVAQMAIEEIIANMKNM